MVAFHIEGGIPYMVPLTLMLIFNIVLVVLEFIRKPGGRDRVELIRQIGLFALVWGVFSTVIAFFFAFGDLSRSGDTIPFEHIMGGLRVALITALYGLVIFLISLAAFILLKYIKRAG